MVASMTGFSTASAAFDWGEITWELRSVNHRYLDQCWQLPTTLKSIEVLLRKTVANVLKRGKFQASLSYVLYQSNQSEWKLDKHNMQQWLHVDKAIREELGGCLEQQSSEALVGRLMQWPGIVIIDKADLSQKKDEIVKVFYQALESLLMMRKHEGAQLVDCLLAKLSQADHIMTEICQHLPKWEDSQKTACLKRWRQIAGEKEQVKYDSSFSLWQQKFDVQEEIDRLKIHIKAMHALLKETDPIGRKLDFLMQELHREANTLAAKAIHVELVHHAIDLKVWTEQVREQIQNIV